MIESMLAADRTPPLLLRAQSIRAPLVTIVVAQCAYNIVYALLQPTLAQATLGASLAVYGLLLVFFVVITVAAWWLGLRLRDELLPSLDAFPGEVGESPLARFGSVFVGGIVEAVIIAALYLLGFCCFFIGGMFTVPLALGQAIFFFGFLLLGYSLGQSLNMSAFRSADYLRWMGGQRGLVASLFLAGLGYLSLSIGLGWVASVFVSLQMFGEIFSQGFDPANFEQSIQAAVAFGPETFILGLVSGITQAVTFAIVAAMGMYWAAHIMNRRQGTAISECLSRVEGA